MIEQASLVIGEGNWAVKSDSLLGYKINNGKYYPREMSVVRATTGTRINEDGLVEVVPYNLFEYSEDFSNSYWSKSNVTITTNNITAPNGTLTADKIAQTAGGFVNGNATGTGLNTYVFSVYLKAGSVSSVRLRESYYYGTSSVFNLTNGTATGTGVIESVGNGWYRCSLPQTYAAGETILAFIIDITTVGDYYAWGAQLVEGSSALDYLPTTDRLDVARIDYSSGSGALLVEPQRTNLALYSSSFDNAYWTKFDDIITANSAVSPSGIQDANKTTPNTNNTFHGIFRIIGSLGASTYAGSVFLKADGFNFGYIRLTTDASKNYTVVIDLTNGTVTATSQSGSPTGVSYKVDNYANGWYKITATSTHTSGNFYMMFGASNVGVPTFVSDIPSFSGNGTNGVLAYGAQLEAGSYPTSYIPTQSATVTRNADVISKTGIADLIGQTEGTVFWEIRIDIQSAVGNESLFTIDDGSAYNNSLYLAKGETGSLNGVIVNGGVIQAQFTLSATTGVFKMALGYANNNSAFFVNGAQVGATDTSCSIPTSLSRIFLGNTPLGPSSSPINAVALYKTRLTNAELATLTTI